MHVLFSNTTLLGLLIAVLLTHSTIGQIAIAAALAGLAYIERRWHRETFKKQEEIHLLVNSRLTEALDEIKDLKKRLDSKDVVIKDQVAQATVIREDQATLDRERGAT